jgi:hypothetical protein
MLHSKIIEFIFTILLFKSWKGYLIRRHIEHCPACQAKLAQEEEVKRLFVQAGDLSNVDHLWPAIQAKLNSSKPEEKTRQLLLRPAWRWTVAAASLMIMFITGFWLIRNYQPDKFRPGEEAKSFEIEYLKIENQPARAFLFQPQDSRIIIVWAEKNT